MPFGGGLTGALSLAGPAVGIGSSLLGLAGGSPASKVQMPPQYNNAYRPQADVMAYGSIDPLSQYNTYGSLLPQYQDIAQSSVNNPYAPAYLQGSQLASGLGVSAGLNTYDAGGAITGNALSALPDVSALLSLGFDPQNALYAKLQQQNRDQNAATLSASGVGTTPYGGGVMADANNNFNIAWQNAQLQRAIQAAQGAGGLMGNIGSGVTTGQGLQSQAPGQILGAGGMPYNAFNTINANALATLGQTGAFGQQGAQIPQMQIQDYLQYLQSGQNQQGVNQQGAQVALNQANQGFQQNQTLGTQLGQSLAGLAKGWGQSGFGGGTQAAGLAPGAFMGS